MVSVMLYPCILCVALLMDLFVLCVACDKMHIDNRCMHMAYVFLYVCCSDCVGVCENVCRRQR